MKIFLLLLAVLIGFPFCRAAAFEISENTQIVTGSNAGASTLFAARELAEYIFKAGSIKPAVVKNSSTAPSQIIIGTLNDVKTLPAAAAENLPLPLLRMLLLLSVRAINSISSAKTG